MKIAVLGGGPAGLYFASLWKSRHPRDEVQLFEQGPSDATWGFGVVFSDRALEFLRGDDPGTYDLITPRMETWTGITLYHQGEAVTIDGVGFSAIGRLELLQLLASRARTAGVEPRYGHAVSSLDELTGFDLVVAADGLNSLVRRAYEGDFSTSVSYLDNKFAWFGTTRHFDTLSHTFLNTRFGSFNAHHYRYQPGMSTFIVECDRETWLAAGFDRRPPDEARALCEEIFAGTLQGHKLVSNRSIWRNFPWLWNDRWSFKNMVLVGDALRTAHFSIGSGTRLAMEDVLALVRSLEAKSGDPAAGLEHYEATRRPIVEKLVAAARRSADWYEGFAEHMHHAPLAFARSYISRSGRLDEARLKQMSPDFAMKLEAAGLLGAA